MTTSVLADDSALGERFRDGDEAAVKAVYRRFRGPLYALAYGLLRDPVESADAVQQAFVQAWRAAPSFDPSRSLAPWLFQITRRVCIDAMRRAGRLPATNASFDHPAEWVDGSMSTELTVERTWIQWEVRRAIDRLPLGEREVMRLAHVDGFTHAEIANLLNVPVGTVKSRTWRAHSRLTNALAHLAPTAS
jgi:RNA polymerase sigma-70 factor, ECF subfamily